MTVTTRCPYCRVELDEKGVIANTGDKHAPSCADRSLENSELKQLFRNRPGTPKKTETRAETGRVEWEAFQVAPEEHLTVALADREVAQPVKRLLGELAALCQMSDANRSVPTDAGRRGPRGSGMPSFDPAAAQRELKAAADRLYQEAEKLAGVTRNPHRSPEPQCEECGKRVRLVDVYCGPCGARILREHRRTRREMPNV